MAISSVAQMVRDRLPYLVDNVDNNALIERMRVQQTYLMQNSSGKSDVDVELEASYRAIENMLFSMMVTYQLIYTKAMLTMAGNGTSAGAPKILKKAKADVMETEWVVTKASDGTLVQIATSEFLADLLKEICGISHMIGWANPLCPLVADVIPPFIIGADYPPRCSRIDIFNGQVI